MTRVYKLLLAPEWESAKAEGRFLGSGVDLADGYIHFSTLHQLAETARRHFAGLRDLVCLALEETDLPALRWEASRGGAMFPHLYATLDTKRVVGVWAVPLDANGAPDVTGVEG